MKVTMVGVSGSGKTAFMSALNDTLGWGETESGFHITPRPSNNTIGEVILKIGDLSQLSISQMMDFPDGTVKTTLWPFNVLYKSKPVTYFDWIDYRGGILTDIFKPARNEAEIVEIISHIIASNAVILLVDSFTLTYFSDVREARVRSGANIIIQLLEAYNRFYPDREIIFAIALTKADTVEDKWKTSDYSPLIDRGLQIFEPLVRLCRRKSNWVGGIVPVSSVGENTVIRTVTETGDPKNPIMTQDQLISFPHPFNAEKVLFFCLCETLKQMREEALDTIQKREQELERIMSQAGLVNTIWSLLTNKKSAKDIAAAIMAERRADYESLRAFEPYIEPLCDMALEKVRLIR